MRSRVEAERAGRADRRFTLSLKRTLSRPSSLIIAALTGAAAALAAAAIAVALLAVPAAQRHPDPYVRPGPCGREPGGADPTPVITGAHLTIVLRHGAAVRPAIRLDSAAAARARYRARPPGRCSATMAGAPASSPH